MCDTSLLVYTHTRVTNTLRVYCPSHPLRDRTCVAIRTALCRALPANDRISYESLYSQASFLTLGLQLMLFPVLSQAVTRVHETRLWGIGSHCLRAQRLCAMHCPRSTFLPNGNRLTERHSYGTGRTRDKRLESHSLSPRVFHPMMVFTNARGHFIPTTFSDRPPLSIEVGNPRRAT